MLHVHEQALARHIEVDPVGSASQSVSEANRTTDAAAVL
jgi:hypothetical protein